MKSSKSIILLALFLMAAVIALKLSKDKVAKLAKPTPPAAQNTATHSPQTVVTTPPPPQTEPAQTPKEEIATTPQPTNETQSAYVSEYKGKSAPFLNLKNKIAEFALREFLADKGLRIQPPFQFYDFSLYEMDLNTSGFDIAPNDFRQEMTIIIRRTTDIKNLLLDIASERNVSLGGDSPPRPLDTKGRFFLISNPDLNIIYYAGPAKAGYSAIVALIQPTPFQTSLIEAFKNSVTPSGN